MPDLKKNPPEGEASAGEFQQEPTSPEREKGDALPVETGSEPFMDAETVALAKLRRQVSSGAEEGVPKVTVTELVGAGSKQSLAAAREVVFAKKASPPEIEQALIEQALIALQKGQTPETK